LMLPQCQEHEPWPTTMSDVFIDTMWSLRAPHAALALKRANDREFGYHIVRQHINHEELCNNMHRVKFEKNPLRFSELPSLTVGEGFLSPLPERTRRMLLADAEPSSRQAHYHRHLQGHAYVLCSCKSWNLKGTLWRHKETVRRVP